MAFAVAQKALRAPVPTARRSVAVAGRPARSLVIRAAGEAKVQPQPVSCRARPAWQQDSCSRIPMVFPYICSVSLHAALS